MELMNGLAYFAAPLTGLPSAGPGIAGYTSWVVATIVVALLAWLAWWTMRPARRASRAELRRADRSGRTRT